MNQTVLAILIIFAVVVLYLISIQYQKSAVERALIASRSSEVAAIADIYRTKVGLAVVKIGKKTTAGDWIGGFTSVLGAAASIIPKLFR